MKPRLLPILLIISSALTAQKDISYYDFQWKKCDVAHARFISVMEHTDSGWHRQDYYVQGQVLQMDGWYEDSACTIRNGKFIFGYPDKKIASVGRYAHNKREGLCISFHANGMMADSTYFEAGQAVGISIGWYQNGNQSDSCVYKPDGSGVEVDWFDNGKPSAAGRWATGHKRQGRWQFFHNNGQLSALELYDQGRLEQKQYYDENGQALTDTTNRDHKASFGKDSTAWLKYLQNNLMWPNGYKITNADVAAVIVDFIVDVDGSVKDAYISVPFFDVFHKEALRTIIRCPKWHPAVEHNRRVPEYMRQPVVFSQPADY